MDKPILTPVMKPPFSISGGCLCGAVRYTLNFPEDAEWPPSGVGSASSRHTCNTCAYVFNQNATCSCTLCRKHTGSLMPQTMTIPTSYISPPLASNPTYKSYESSPNCYRSFCSTCGSSLTFNSRSKPEETELYLGSLDEEVLIGKRVQGSERKDEYGIHVDRDGGYGRDLKPPAHIYYENAIPGFTDQLEGLKYLTDRQWKALE